MITWDKTQTDHHNSVLYVWIFERWRVDFNRVSKRWFDYLSRRLTRNKYKNSEYFKIILTRNSIIKVGYNEFCLSLPSISFSPWNPLFQLVKSHNHYPVIWIKYKQIWINNNDHIRIFERWISILIDFQTLIPLLYRIYNRLKIVDISKLFNSKQRRIQEINEIGHDWSILPSYMSRCIDRCMYCHLAIRIVER